MTKARELAELGKAVSVHDNRLDFDRSIAHTGVVTANAGVKVDNITIDGTEIDLSSGDLTLDVANDIILDVDHVIRFHKNSTAHGNIQLNSNDLTLASQITDADIKFVGASSGSSVLALTLDMSANGDATFNGQVIVPQYVTHAGDGNTYLEFNTDQIDLYAGGVHGIQIVNNEVIINQGGADVNFRVEGDNQANLFVVDAGNDRVGIGTSSPNNKLHVEGSEANVVGVQISNTEGSGSRFDLYALGSSPAIQSAHRNAIYQWTGNGIDLWSRVGDLRFGTSNAERMRIDSSGNLGLGTSSPSSSFAGARNLVIGGGSGHTGMTILSGTSSRSSIEFSDGTGSDATKTAGGIRYYHDSNYMRFNTNGGTERMRILSGGEVAIGGTGYSGQPFSLQTSSVNLGYMQTTSTTRGVMNFRDGNSTNNIGFGCIGNNHVFMKDSTERMRIDSSGRVAIGSTSITASADFDDLQIGSNGGTSGLTILSSGSATAGIAFADPAESVAHSLVCHHADNSMRFNVNGNTERMRITSSGNVGIGISSPDSKLHVLGRFHSSSNNATTHPGSNDNTEHYISDYAKIGGKSLIGFSVVFPNGTSNLAIRLYALQNSLWISGDVIIGSTYSNGNASGFRRYSFTHNQNGSTNYNYSLTNTENRGGTNGHFELAGHGWDSSEGVGAHYWEFRHIASSGNAMYVQFETMGSGVAYSPNWYWRHTTY